MLAISWRLAAFHQVVRSNDYNKTKILCVILSGVRSTESNFCGLSEANKQKHEPLGEVGYGSKSRWLASGM